MLPTPSFGLENCARPMTPPQADNKRHQAKARLCDPLPSTEAQIHRIPIPSTSADTRVGRSRSLRATTLSTYAGSVVNQLACATGSESQRNSWAWPPPGRCALRSGISEALLPALTRVQEVS